MSLLPTNIQMWLRKAPRPIAILADEKRIDVPMHGRAWKEVSATILALKPSALTAIDVNGTIIRAIRMDGAKDDDEDVEAKTERNTLQHFANLLSDAYDKGSKAGQPLLDSAMQFIERQGNRLIVQDKEIERLRAVNAKMALEIGELRALPEATDEGDNVLSALAQGMMAAQAQQENNVAPIKGKKP